MLINYSVMRIIILQFWIGETLIKKLCMVTPGQAQAIFNIKKEDLNC